MYLKMYISFIGEPYLQFLITLKISLKLGGTSIIILTLQCTKQVQMSKLICLMSGLESYSAGIITWVFSFLVQ